MDKWVRVNYRMDILKIKTGIDGYRGFLFVCDCIFVMFFLFSLIFDRKEIEIIISLLLIILFIIMTIFTEQIVYFFHLPTNYLIISKDKILIRKREKEIEYSIKDTTIVFKSFFEDFQPSLLYLKSFNKEDCVLLTKKQYKQIVNFLNEKKHSNNINTSH